MAGIEVFVAQWGLDSNAHAALASLPKHIQEKVAIDFQPKPGTRDVNRLFHGFLKSVQNPGGKGMSKGAPTAAQAFGGGSPPAASPSRAPLDMQTFLEQWGLDDSALAMLMEQPPEVQERVLAEFSPKPGTRDINRLIHGFVRSLRTNSFPHLQAPGAAPGAGSAGLGASQDNGEAAAIVQLFAEQWGLDEANQAALLQCDPAVQAKVISAFVPKPGTRDVNRLFQGFLRSQAGGRAQFADAPWVGSPAHTAAGGLAAVQALQARQAATLNAALQAQAELDAAMAQLIGGAAPGADPFALQAFAEQWGLDAEAQAVLMQMDAASAAKVMSDFQPKPGTRDVNRLFHGFVKSMRSSGAAAAWGPVGSGRSAPTAAMAFAPSGQPPWQASGGKRPGFPGGAAATLEEIGLFAQTWGLGEDCLEALAGQAPEVQRRVLDSFRPKPDTRDVRSLFFGFIRSVTSGGGGPGGVKRPRFS